MQSPQQFLRTLWSKDKELWFEDKVKNKELSSKDKDKVDL